MPDATTPLPLDDPADLYIRPAGETAGPCSEIRNRKTRLWHSLYKDHAEAERFLQYGQQHAALTQERDRLAGENRRLLVVLRMAQGFIEVHEERQGEQSATGNTVRAALSKAERGG